jgi:hypothetical protein
LYEYNFWYNHSVLVTVRYAGQDGTAFLPEDYILSVALRPALSECSILQLFTFDVSSCERFVTLVLTLGAHVLGTDSVQMLMCVCGRFHLLTFNPCPHIPLPEDSA